MAKCDWVFLNKDDTKDQATLDGAAPSPGDGKVHNGKGYRVRHIISGRSTTPNDAVIATEH